MEKQSENKKKVLYIEDEPYNRLLVKKLLSLQNIETVEAEDGLTGIELVKNNKFDLILIDINMEGMNGYEVATIIRTLENGKDTPMVALTANVLQRSRDRALISGCDGFMTKPIDQATFFSTLKEYMNGRKDFVDSSKIDELMKQNNKELVYHLEKEIKELKRAINELKEIDKIKSDFIALASHELRTPLVTIVGYIGLILSKMTGEIPEKIEKMLRIVDRNSKKLERIVSNLFTINMLEKKINILRKSDVNLVKLIYDIVEDLALVFDERKLNCHIYSNENIPLVNCDEEKIGEVFSAIIGNAIKYTEDGGEISIYITYPAQSILRKYDLDPQQYVEVVVKDTGIGIPPDKLTKIFEKFVELSDIERHHSSDTEFMGGGFGLGLSLSKSVVEMHHGFIWAENRKVKGSKFYIILPLKSPYGD